MEEVTITDRRKKKKGNICSRCLSIAGLAIIMRRAYHRIDKSWEPLGYYCPNCFCFEPEPELIEAQRVSKELTQSIADYLGHQEDDWTDEDRKIFDARKRRIQILLQSIYNK